MSVPSSVCLQTYRRLHTGPLGTSDGAQALPCISCTRLRAGSAGQPGCPHLHRTRPHQPARDQGYERGPGLCCFTGAAAACMQHVVAELLHCAMLAISALGDSQTASCSKTGLRNSQVLDRRQFTWLSRTLPKVRQIYTSVRSSSRL